MEISDITLKDLIDAIADAVVDRLGGAAPAPKKRGGAATETTPPSVDDGDSDDAPTGDAPAEEVTPDDDEDLVTEAQLKFVDENFEKKSAEDMRTELAEFYESYGDSPEDIAKEVAELKGKELNNSYKDYLARLVTHGDDGEVEDFLQEWEEPYRAVRIYSGEEKWCWVKAGLTFTDDEASEAGLGDADPSSVEEEKPKTPPKRTRKPKGGKKK